jgi:electron transfer flavoprotein alpha subunit
MTLSTLIAVGANPAIGSIVEQVAPLGETVAVVAGPRATADSVAAQGVGRVVWLGADPSTPPEALASALAEVAAELAPDLLVAPNRGPDRVLLGVAAARLGAPLLPFVGSLTLESGRLVIERAAVGALITERLTVEAGPVAVVMDGGLAGEGDPVAVQERAGQANGIVICAETAHPDAAVDLGAAPVVVAVGRGLKDRADLALIENLAARLGAAVGCTRPLAEGVDWLPKDRYIGVSGQVVSPPLYLALGVSGQLQHVVGMRGSGTVVAVNTDAKAPIFAECDYGIVGDLYEVVPALIAALS